MREFFKDIGAGLSLSMLAEMVVVLGIITNIYLWATWTVTEDDLGTTAVVSHSILTTGDHTLSFAEKR